MLTVAIETSQWHYDDDNDDVNDDDIEGSLSRNNVSEVYRHA